jgi:transposase-like protein
MERPDLDTVACLNPACQRFRQRDPSKLVVRNIYGSDAIRLWRCRTCGAEFSERRGTALCKTTLPESNAEDVSKHLGEGCSVRATARLGKGWKERVARLVRVAGRHAEHLHEQHVRHLRPMALECDEQWRGVKKTRVVNSA